MKYVVHLPVQEPVCEPEEPSGGDDMEEPEEMVPLEDIASDSEDGAGSSEEHTDPKTLVGEDVEENVGEDVMDDVGDIGEDVGEDVEEDVGGEVECPSTPPPKTSAKTPEWFAQDPSSEMEWFEEGQGGTPTPPKSPSKDLEFEEPIPKCVLIEDSPISSNKTPDCPLSQKIAMLTKKLADAKREHMAWNFGFKLVNLGGMFLDQAICFKCCQCFVFLFL